MKLEEKVRVQDSHVLESHDACIVVQCVAVCCCTHYDTLQQAAGCTAVLQCVAVCLQSIYEATHTQQLCTRDHRIQKVRYS